MCARRIDRIHREHRIEAKAAKLREISAPKLLVLHDKHAYSDLDHFVDSVRVAPASDSFHTIFVTRRYADGVALTTRFPGSRGVWDSTEAF